MNRYGSITDCAAYLQEKFYCFVAASDPKCKICMVGIVYNPNVGMEQLGRVRVELVSGIFFIFCYAPPPPSVPPPPLRAPFGAYNH